MRDNRVRPYGRIAAGVLVTWVLFAALWLTATVLLIKPGKVSPGHAGPGPLGLHHRKTADDSRVTAPAD